MTRKLPTKQDINHAISMLVVSGLSLFLLIYVGFGEAQRNYQHFVVERMTAQGKIVQNAMETFLRAGLPITQFVGFNTLAEPILSSDKTIASMVVVDSKGKRVFASGEKSNPILSPTLRHEISPEDPTDIRMSDDYYQVVLPLRNKFEPVGSLLITIPSTVVTQRLQDSFGWLIYVAIGLSLAFALFVSFATPHFSGRRTPWLQIVYAVTFIVMAGTVISNLASLYSEGAQTKTKALADSLGHRLGDVVEFNLNIDEFEGLDRTLGEYRRLNPDISATALIVNNNVLIHTNPAMVGKSWKEPPRSYVYAYDLTRPEISANRIHVAVALPVQIVFQRVARTVKNFAALFIATAFLAGLFLQLAATVQKAQARINGEANATTKITAESALSLVKPVFFLAVFAEHLTYSFLAQFMHQVTTQAGLTDGYASALFMSYYLCFALALVPAGHFAEQHGPRRLMYLGLLLAGLGLLCMTTVTLVADAGAGTNLDYLAVLAARAISGIGQAMLFIGVQSYILDMAAPEKKTQGAAIIVFGFQGGMISGTAIGSLIVVYMGEKGVFSLGAVIALGMAIYALSLLPATSRQRVEDRSLGFAVRKFLFEMGAVLRNPELLKAMMLVGIPTKAVMTGVILFALPLLLSEMAYAQEDIGQIIMVYAAGVLVASVYVPRFVDRTGRSQMALFWGTAISGIGLVVIGAMDVDALQVIPYAVTTVVVVGVLVVGLAHGSVYAPIVTHVADSAQSKDLGPNSVTATYRFLERVGHVAGPMIIGYLFMTSGQHAQVVTWVGLAVLIFAFLFLVRFDSLGSEELTEKVT